MTDYQKIRRAGIICLHCLRNIALYQASYPDDLGIQDDQFLVSANGNFLDIAVLEWCKIFGSVKEKHNWGRIVIDNNLFENGLHENIDCTKEEFTIYQDVMLTYRDKFVGHLDEENTMDIPDLTKAIKSTLYLYQHLLEITDGLDVFADAPADAEAFYNRYFSLGKVACSKLIP
jgi:hypothetical protein